TDLGIAGDGMFVVNEAATPGNGNEFLFTRDGSFITDTNGNLMTSTGGLFLQGLPFDQNGNLPTLAFANLQTVNIQGLSVTAEPTTLMDIAANLPADDTIGTVHQVTLPLYDSQGSLQNMDYFFVKTATDTWALTGRFSDANTAFASNDSTTANLAATALANQTNFTFNSTTGNFFGSARTDAGDITVTKTTSSNVNVSVAIGADTFEANFTIPNALTNVTNFTYASATTTTTGATVPAINGAYTGASAAVTPGSPHSIAITIGGTVYTATVPQVGGNDITAPTTLAFVNGNDTLTLNVVGGPYDLDVPGPGAGTEAQFETDLNAALLGLTFSSGSIVDGVNDLAPAGTLTLTSSGGQTFLLDVPAGGASYDLSNNTDMTALDTNLTAALNGVVLSNNTVGFRMADISFSAAGRLQGITTRNAPFTSVNANDELEFFVDFDGSAATDISQDRNQITLDLGTFGQLDGMKQFAGDFFVESTDQNGKRFGNFTTLEISEEGIVTAVFDNGERTNIYQLVIADFANINGLEPRSDNGFQETDFSGQAQILLPNTAGAGSVVSGALEASTVDIAEEFTRMIVTQRAYSASSRIITTSDEMLEELLTIAR
ncbi:MAG: flagellar hook-basal body complex protein, partial [Kiloniellales bacterium]|nr:flagellar hook-basal body complex protein [Kiloniellales bacterium]